MDAGQANSLQNIAAAVKTGVAASDTSALPIVTRLALDQINNEWFLYSKDQLLGVLVSLGVCPRSDEQWVKAQEPFKDQITGTRNDLITTVPFADRLASQIEEASRKSDIARVASLAEVELKHLVYTWIVILESAQKVNRAACEKLIENAAKAAVEGQASGDDENSDGHAPDPFQFSTLLEYSYEKIHALLESMVFNPAIDRKKDVLDLNWAAFKSLGGGIGADFSKAPCPVLINEDNAAFAINHCMAALLRTVSRAHQAALNITLNDDRFYESGQKAFESSGAWPLIKAALFNPEQAFFSVDRDGSLTLSVSVAQPVYGYIHASYEKLQWEIKTLQKITAGWGLYFEPDLAAGEARQLSCRIYFPRADGVLLKKGLPPSMSEPCTDWSVDDYSNAEMEFQRCVMLKNRPFSYKVSTTCGAILTEDARRNFLAILKRADRMISSHPRLDTLVVRAPSYAANVQPLFDTGELSVNLYGDCRPAWRVQKEKCYDDLFEALPWEEAAPQRPDTAPRPIPFLATPFEALHVLMNGEVAINDPKACAGVGRILKLGTPLTFEVGHEHEEEKSDALSHTLMHALVEELERALLRLQRDSHGARIPFRVYPVSQSHPAAADLKYVVRFYGPDGDVFATGFLDRKAMRLRVERQDPALPTQVVYNAGLGLQRLNLEQRVSYEAVKNALQNVGVLPCERLVDTLRIGLPTIQLSDLEYLHYVNQRMQLLLEDPMIVIRRGRLSKRNIVRILDLAGFNP